MDQSGVHLLEFEPRFERQVQALILAVYEEFGYRPYLDADLLAIAQTYVGRSRFWVAVNGDSVVGTGAVRERSPVTAEVKRMYVLAPFRGQGIGLAILGHAAGFARLQGYRCLRLETFPRLERAVRLYERYGFQKTGSGAGGTTSYELLLGQG